MIYLYNIEIGLAWISIFRYSKITENNFGISVISIFEYRYSNPDKSPKWSIAHAVDGAARMEHKEKRCCHPQKYAPEPGDGEYSETVMDSKGKEMVILRRFEAISHRCSPCWRFCCPFCWCCGRCAACWRQEMVAEVDMPAGTRIATISYDTRAGQRSPVLKVITVKDSVGYSVLFPKKEVKLAPGSGPAFQLFRDGSRSPIGRIQRMIDVNSGVCPSIHLNSPYFMLLLWHQ